MLIVREIMHCKPTLKAFEDMMSGMGQSRTDDDKEMEKIMKDYHELIVDGRREIYKVEG